VSLLHVYEFDFDLLGINRRKATSAGTSLGFMCKRQGFECSVTAATDYIGMETMRLSAMSNIDAAETTLSRPFAFA
jgi:hypothetical protein